MLYVMMFHIVLDRPITFGPSSYGSNIDLRPPNILRLYHPVELNAKPIRPYQIHRQLMLQIHSLGIE